MTNDEVKIAKLRGALATAPRPTTQPDAQWMVRYMDWFFQPRISVLDETSRDSSSARDTQEKP